MDALVRDYGATWAPELWPSGKGPGDYSSHLFRRGFVEGRGISTEGFGKAFEELVAQAPILELSLGQEQGRVASITGDPNLRRLRWLWLEGITDEDVIALAECPYLENLLFLSVTGIDDGREALEALAWSPNLPKLEILRFGAERAWLPDEVYEGDYGDYNELWKVGNIVPGTIRLPPAGAELEKKYGYKKWLHGPSRFGDRHREGPTFLYDDEMVEPPPPDVLPILLDAGYGDLLAPEYTPSES
jgi:hypothetical protein